MSEFRGWGADLRTFFTGLAEHNTRDYFEANRDLYQRGVREPAEALVATLAPRYGEGRIFRMNRDVRFSADKRPYHTNLGIQFSGAGVHHYLSVSADQLFASAGLFRPSREWTGRFRLAVAGPPGDDLAKIVADLESRGLDIGGEELKRTPQGYPADHRNARLLRFKSITVNRWWPVSAWLGNPAVLGLITGFYAQAQPLTGWLSVHSPAGD